jgi:hypothetical protein
MGQRPTEDVFEAFARGIKQQDKLDPNDDVIV